MENNSALTLQKKRARLLQKVVGNKIMMSRCYYQMLFLEKWRSAIKVCEHEEKNTEKTQIALYNQLQSTFAKAINFRTKCRLRSAFSMLCLKARLSIGFSKMENTTRKLKNKQKQYVIIAFRRLVTRRFFHIT